MDSKLATGTILHTIPAKVQPHDHAYEEVIGELTITPKGLGGSIHFENLIYLRCTHPGCPSLKFPVASKDFIEAEVKRQRQANAEEIDKKMAEISARMLEEGPRVKTAGDLVFGKDPSRPTPGLGKGLAAALAKATKTNPVFPSEANSLLRSALSIAERQGRDTNWPALISQLRDELQRQADANTSLRAATITAKTFKIAPEEDAE